MLPSENVLKICCGFLISQQFNRVQVNERERDPSEWLFRSCTSIWNLYSILTFFPNNTHTPEIQRIHTQKWCFEKLHPRLQMYGHFLQYVGVCKNRGTQKWMVYNLKTLLIHGWFGRKTHYFRKHPMCLLMRSLPNLLLLSNHPSIHPSLPATSKGAHLMPIFDAHRYLWRVPGSRFHQDGPDEEDRPERSKAGHQVEKTETVAR